MTSYTCLFYREDEERERERGGRGRKEAFYLVLRNFASHGFRSTQHPINGVVVVTVFYSERGQGSGGGGELGSARLSSFNLHVHVLR